MNNCEEYEKELRTRPKDYFGEIHEWMDEGFSAGMFTVHRDSEILEISNYEGVKEILQKWIDGDEGAVRISSSNHWAVGWVDQIHVKIRNRKGEFTKPFKIACRLVDQLRDYPVLDDEDYSRREHEDLWNWVDTEVEDTDKCVSWLYENYSVSRSDDVHYEWIEEWRKENEPEDDD